MPAGCRVLIVEDHRPSLDGLSLALRLHGFEPCPSETVAQAVAKLDGQEAAVLDFMLPDGSGLEVLQHIRNEGKRMRVALVSALDLDPGLLKAQGFDAVFPKPLTPDRLEALIQWLKQG